MEEIMNLVGIIEGNVNDFLADAKKTIAPKLAWQRARQMTIILQKQFKEYRKLSVEIAKTIKREKKDA